MEMTVQNKIGFNRNIVECKFAVQFWLLCAAQGFNRNIVECK